MDTRPDEAERGVTIKSTAITLHFELLESDLKVLHSEREHREKSIEAEQLAAKQREVEAAKRAQDDADGKKDKKSKKDKKEKKDKKQVVEQQEMTQAEREAEEAKMEQAMRLKKMAVPPSVSQHCASPTVQSMAHHHCHQPAYRADTFTSEYAHKTPSPGANDTFVGTFGTVHITSDPSGGYGGLRSIFFLTQRHLFLFSAPPYPPVLHAHPFDAQSRI